VWLPFEVASGTPLHLPCRARAAGRLFLSPGSVILSAMGRWIILGDDSETSIRTGPCDGCDSLTGSSASPTINGNWSSSTWSEDLRPPPILAAREEAAVDLVASRQLIRLSQLEDALAWSRCPAEAKSSGWMKRHCWLGCVTYRRSRSKRWSGAWRVSISRSPSTVGRREQYSVLRVGGEDCGYRWLHEW